MLNCRFLVTKMRIYCLNFMHWLFIVFIVLFCYVLCVQLITCTINILTRINKLCYLFALINDSPELESDIDFSIVDTRVRRWTVRMFVDIKWLNSDCRSRQITPQPAMSLTTTTRRDKTTEIWIVSKCHQHFGQSESTTRPSNPAPVRHASVNVRVVSHPCHSSF